MGILLATRTLYPSVQLRCTQGYACEKPEVYHASDFVRVEQVRDCAAWVVHVAKGVQKSRRFDDNR